MGDTSFRGKPSGSHVVWTRETREGATSKRFDREELEQWADHYGFETEREVRVDHDRAGEPRQQVRCVFAWGTVEAETIELDGEEWSMGDQRTPRTFLELDSEGLARVSGWSTEAILEVVELYHDGPALVIETAAGERKRLDARDLV